jgi:hypothetical protein
MFDGEDVMDKVWLLFGVSLIIIGVVSGVKDSMKAEYARGYKAGADSLTTKQVDDVCAAWLFDSDLTAAKKRICGK